MPSGTDPATLLGLSPARVRELGAPALEALAADIRSFLISAVSENGGHLGSNLGVVELTLALHRCFESPRDQIVWDTGHQTYVHKILTGRAGDFPTLRRAQGLSGYANRGESTHDLVENSHASTALSYAYGLARARDLAQTTQHVVAVVGDGSLTGGLAYEALSNIGAHGTRVVIILNDNGRSYAPTVSNLSTAGRPGVDAVAPAAFFGGLGIRYEGPVDGHDLMELEEAIARVARTAGPVVLHVHTEKGHGYLPAESDDEKRLHDIGPFDPLTGVAHARSVVTASFTEAFGSALVREAAAHPELMAITAAMPGSCGLIEFSRRYPERFIDVGIAEQHAVAAAAGLAMGGFRPVVAIYSTFLNRAWDQLYYDVGLHGLPVIFCIDRAGITGDDGPSHNGVMDLALLTKVPGMTVLAPSSYEEIPVMLAQAIAITSGPVALRWPKTEARHSAATGNGLSARRVRVGGEGVLLGAREDGRGLRTGGRGALRPRGRGHGVGRSGGRTPGSAHAVRCAPTSRGHHSRGRGGGRRRGCIDRHRPPRHGGTRATPGHRVVRTALGVLPAGEGGRHPLGSRPRRPEPGPKGAHPVRARW